MTFFVLRNKNKKVGSKQHWTPLNFIDFFYKKKIYTVLEQIGGEELLTEFLFWGEISF